jgi:hypothetical protein
VGLCSSPHCAPLLDASSQAMPIASSRVTSLQNVIRGQSTKSTTVSQPGISVLILQRQLGARTDVSLSIDKRCSLLIFMIFQFLQSFQGQCIHHDVFVRSLWRPIIFKFNISPPTFGATSAPERNRLFVSAEHSIQHKIALPQ